MKRQQFRLGNVLRYYVIQKQRSEFELQRASLALHEVEAEMNRLNAEITAVAGLLQGETAASLTTTGWIACYRRAQSLEGLLKAAQIRRQQQAEVVAQLQGQRKRWAQAEETLLSLRRALDENNKMEAAKAQQILLDETVLRRWPLEESIP